MIRYEIRNLCLQGGSLLSSLSFFALALFCLALAIGPDPTLLKKSGPALFWILAILTTLFSTPFLLKNEAKQGVLDEILLHPLPSAFYLLSKDFSQWLLIGLPLAGLSFVLSPWFFLSFQEAFILSLTLILGFPALSALGILGGLLTLSARGGGILIALLSLPLALPLLIFSLSVLEMTRLGLDSFPSFCLLGGVSLLIFTISIGISTWALRFAGEG